MTKTKISLKRLSEENLKKTDLRCFEIITTYRLQRFFAAGKIAGIYIATFYYYNLPVTGKT